MRTPETKRLLVQTRPHASGLFTLTAGVRLPAACSFVYQFFRDVDHERIHFRASKMRLNGVSLVRLNCVKPPAKTVSRMASSGATAPRAGPFKASEFEVQQSVEAPAKVRPMGLKFSSTVFPAIGSTIIALPSALSTSAARLQAPTGSPMSCRQSKKHKKS